MILWLSSQFVLLDVRYLTIGYSFCTVDTNK